MKMRIPVFFSVLLLLLLPGAVCAFADRDDEKAEKPEKVLLDFSGVPSPGTAFHFRIRSIRTRNCEMKVLGMERPPVRRDTREILAAGKLFYKSKGIVDGTLVRELEFTADSISGTINGERHDFPEFTGKTFHITVTGKETSFRLAHQQTPPDPAGSLAADVLSGRSEERSGASDGKIPADLLYFLRSIFGCVSDPPMNYLGASAWMERGKHAPLDPTPILQALRQEGIPADKEDVEYFSEYDGSTVYLGIPVRRVNMLIQGAGIPGCDFKLEISLLYPYGKYSPASGPVRISRKALFVADPYLPEGNALLSGSRLETVETDMTDIQLVPESMMPR